MTVNAAITHRLGLARKLVADHLGTVDTFCEFNEQIESLLGVNWAEAADNGADTPLPGNGVSEVRTNLLRVIELAEQPVPDVKKGRWRLIPQPVAQARRNGLLLLARRALAAIDGEPVAAG